MNDSHHRFHLSLRGFCFHRKAMKLREANGLTAEVDQLYAKSSQEYLEAALTYPPDEEHHVCQSPFLSIKDSSNV